MRKMEWKHEKSWLLKSKSVTVTVFTFSFLATTKCWQNALQFGLNHCRKRWRSMICYTLKRGKCIWLDFYHMSKT